MQARESSLVRDQRSTTELHWSSKWEPRTKKTHQPNSLSTKLSYFRDDALTAMASRRLLLWPPGAFLAAAETGGGGSRWNTCVDVTKAVATTGHFASLMKTCSIVYKVWWLPWLSIHSRCPSFGRPPPRGATNRLYDKVPSGQTNKTLLFSRRRFSRFCYGYYFGQIPQRLSLFRKIDVCFTSKLSSGVMSLLCSSVRLQKSYFWKPFPEAFLQ